MKYSKYSVVIIGSGISGLYLAHRLSSLKHLKDGILVVSKSSVEHTNSSLAQGGISAVLEKSNKEDSISSHIADTIKAGCGLNDFNVVKFFSESSSLIIEDLENIGVEFDKTLDGKLSFALEGAHSAPRVLHIKDETGKQIHQAILNKVINNSDIDIYENCFALQILKDASNNAKGVVVYNKNTQSYEAVYANSTVIATGGVGQVYEYTTNVKPSTADGIALAIDANAKIENMEFVQFHPTALAVSSQDSLPLVSEAVRGAGAKLCDSNGDYFAKKYHPQAELAPRDIVSRAIFDVMKANNDDNVFLDISPMGIDYFRTRFPNIAKYCENNSIDYSDGLIPVTPAAHYFMGGIKTDLYARTSIDNLFAIGEVASTGLHGANRLASNSLLECCVSAYELAEYLADCSLEPPKTFDENIKNVLNYYKNYGEVSSDYEFIDTHSIKDELKRLMWKNAGIIRNEHNLISAKFQLAKYLNQVESSTSDDIFRYYELKNMLKVSLLIVDSALKREISIGAHFRSDEAINDAIDSACAIINEDNNSEAKKYGEVFTE